MNQLPDLGTKKTTLLKKYDIPLTHLSYEYVEKCNDIKELERIVRILRSGEEGDYPQLTESAEKRLTQLAPQSRVLRKEEPVLTKCALGPERWKELSNEMEEWTEEMKCREHELQNIADECQPKYQVPDVRKSKSKMTKNDTVAKTMEEETKPKPKRAVPRDYSDWDKFDADKEILRMEVEEERRKEEAERKKKQLEKEKKKKESQQDSKDVLSEAVQLTVTERKFMATQEKDKGNEYYNDGKYDEAVKHYSTSISLDPTPVAYNNRAMAYLKLNNFNAALADCNEVLKTEPLNVKALLRRGMAYKNKENFPKALEDFSKVVELEPENPQGKSLLAQMEEKCKSKLKSVRMAIQDENSSVAEKSTASSSFPSPCKNIKLNEWGLATRMCNCGGVPSWVRRPPPKCKACAKKRAERQAKKEQERAKEESESVEMCSDKASGAGDVDARDEAKTVPLADRSASGDTSKKSKDSKLLRRKVTSEAEVKDPVKQMRVQVADKYKKTVRKAGEESRHAEMCSGASSMTWRELENISSPFEFVKEWQSIKADSDLSAHARVLRAVKPANLNTVIGSKLDGPMLSLILACLDKHFVTTDAKLALEYLRCLSELPRFNIVSMFLQPPEKQVVWSLFEKLEIQGHHPPATLKKAFTNNNY